MPFPTKRQRMRFKLEKRNLRETFGKFLSFHEVSSEQRVEVTLKTSKNNDYTLRCYLGVDYPNSMPSMVVSSPEEPLKDASGVPLGLSYENHCLGYEVYGLTGICHCRPDRWDNRNMNLSEVFIKGILWLEAYEIMKETGESLSTFLPEMPMSEESLEKLKKAWKRDVREFNEAIEDFVNQMMFQMNCQSVEELLARLCFVEALDDEEMDEY